MMESSHGNEKLAVQVETTWIDVWLAIDLEYKTFFGLVPISSSAPWPLGATYVPTLLSEVEQEQRSSGNGDREAIVVGVGLCDSVVERAYTVYDPVN